MIYIRKILSYLRLLPGILFLVFIAFGFTACDDNFNEVMKAENGGETDPELTSSPVPGSGGVVTIFNITDDGVTLIWTKADDDVSLHGDLLYKVYGSASYTLNSAEDAELYGFSLVDWSTNITTAEITGLDPGTVYYLKVIVKDEDGYTGAYNTVSMATTGSSTDTTDPVPGNSGTIAAAAASSTSVDLTWTQAEDNTSLYSALEYRVFWSEQANVNTCSSMENVGEMDLDWTTDVTSHTVTELTPGTTYYFNVCVRDEAENSAAYSIVSEATIDISGDTTDPVPGNSGTIAAAAASSTSVDLTWTQAEDNTSPYTALEYKVYWNDLPNVNSCSSMENQGEVALDWTANVTSYTVTGLPTGDTYYFNICVRDEAGNSDAYDRTDVYVGSL
ncbi:MAG: fibronectin type III domain-containing protein [bacterium]|nr:fibronectin type III domain-containing protein [bacterium]